MRRARPVVRRAGVMLVIGCVLAACTIVGTGIAPGPEGARYRCNGFPFDPTLIDAPPAGTAERDDDPRSAALRAHLQEPGRPDFLPETGWHLVGVDANRAEFIAKWDHGYAAVSLERSDEAWAVAGSRDCSPELVMAGGARAATWHLALDAAPDRTSTSITVLVSERSCASGHSPHGRIVGPQIVAEARVIRIAFGVHPLPGAQECLEGPPARVVVELGQPVGNRQLSDFGVWPPINESAE